MTVRVRIFFLVGSSKAIDTVFRNVSLPRRKLEPDRSEFEQALKAAEDFTPLYSRYFPRKFITVAAMRRKSPQEPERLTRKSRIDPN